MGAQQSQRTGAPVLVGFIVANVAVMVVALVGAVAPEFSLDLVLPPWYPPSLVFLGSGIAVVVALFARSARRAYGVDMVLLIMTGGNLVAAWLGLAGPFAPKPAEHMEATLAVVAICALLVVAVLLGRAQQTRTRHRG